MSAQYRKDIHYCNVHFTIFPVLKWHHCLLKQASGEYYFSSFRPVSSDSIQLLEAGAIPSATVISSPMFYHESATLP